MKQSGLGDRLWVAGRDLSGDTQSLQQVGGGSTPLNMTGIDKEAFERAGGKRDGAINFTSFFNKASGQAHPTLSALPRIDVVVTYGRGAGLGVPAASILAKQVNYDPTRAEDGSLTIAVQALANGFGLDWGVQATPGVRSDTVATDGDSIDGGAASAFGLQAFLHVVSFTGTDITITVEDSADDVAFAATTGGVFTEVTSAPFSERIETARDATIRRYVRVATSTTGGFSECSFVVGFTRNEVEVVF